MVEGTICADNLEMGMVGISTPEVSSTEYLWSDRYDMNSFISFIFDNHNNRFSRFFTPSHKQPKNLVRWRQSPMRHPD